MWIRLTPPERDPLWMLTAAFHADPRPGKIDLGLGVYRDETGVTPVLRAVREAEARLAREAASKTYRALAGHAAFNRGMTQLLLGAGHEATGSTSTLQTVGGTGALRLLAELVATARPDATVWLSNPGYVNHRPIMSAAGLQVREYRWVEADETPIVAEMLRSLERALPGDVVLVQGCCHNPTGLDPTARDWQAIADVCRERGLVPLVDLAYQGLGDGLDDDAFGLRLLSSTLDTVLVASSCSKNMGLYCERTGAASVIVRDASAREAVVAVMENIARRSYSMPPDHGAAVAAALMADPALWLAELAEMRQRIRGVRQGLADEFERLGAPASMRAVTKHRGMFSTLPLDEAAMRRLRKDHAIYGTPGGRVNLAGLRTDQLGVFASAVVSAAAPCSEREPALVRAG